MSTCYAMPSLVVSNSVACQAPLSMGILQARILEWVVMPSSRGSSQTRNWTQVSGITGGFFTNWATMEAEEYWSGKLFQRIFPTQELNWGLLHWRQILYKQSYQGSPYMSIGIMYIFSNDIKIRTLVFKVIYRFLFSTFTFESISSAMPCVSLYRWHLFTWFFS